MSIVKDGFLIKMLERKEVRKSLGILTSIVLWNKLLYHLVWFIDPVRSDPVGV